MAVTGYREAMTYVLQLAKDDTVETVDEGLLKSLHFMMTSTTSRRTRGVGARGRSSSTASSPESRSTRGLSERRCLP